MNALSTLFLNPVRSPAASTATSVTSASPIISADAVDAVPIIEPFNSSDESQVSGFTGRPTHHRDIPAVEEQRRNLPLERNTGPVLKADIVQKHDAERFASRQLGPNKLIPLQKTLLGRTGIQLAIHGRLRLSTNQDKFFQTFGLLPQHRNLPLERRARRGNDEAKLIGIRNCVRFQIILPDEFGAGASGVEHDRDLITLQSFCGTQNAASFAC